MSAPVFPLMVWAFISMLAFGSTHANGQTQPTDDASRSAGLLIVTPAVGREFSDSMWERELYTHATQMSHDSLMSAVVTDCASDAGVRKTFDAKNDPGAALDWLRHHLRIEVIPHTNLIRVYVDKADDPSEIRRIIESVGNRYIEQSKARENSTVLERVSTINQFKTRLENRIRELCDRQANLMLNLSLCEVGSEGRHTATDVEVQAYINKQADLRVAAAAAQANLEATRAKLDARDPQVVAAEAAVAANTASLDAVNKHLAELKDRLGDLGIKMADYISTTNELQAVRREYSELKDRLDKICAETISGPIDWAARPQLGR